MFHDASRRLTVCLTLGVLLCTAGAATLAARPAVAASVVVGLNSLVRCATTTACVIGTNTNSGPGVSGSSVNSFGVTGTSTNGFGMLGTSAKVGVWGISSGTAANSVGVFGQSPYLGVRGFTTTGDGYSVSGFTTSGIGVWGQSSSGGVGAGGQSLGGIGVYATSGTGPGLYAHSSQGIGVRSSIDGGGFSVVGTSSNGQGSGADFEGGQFGIVGRAQPSGYPLVLTDSSYNNVFYVSGTGDVYYTGNLQPFLRTSGGAMVSSYTPKSSRPTVEDTGTAQLTAGYAVVTLEPTFAATVDKSAPYRVFITPDGDTRGLFVAQKTARGFTVRETQGGHSNLAFDYRIVATGQGEAGKHMAVRDAGIVPNAPAAAAATSPRAASHNPAAIDRAGQPVHP